jgi:hypothetical protein
MEVITIGRNPVNNVVINDPKVSRHHLQIIKDDYGNFRVADFGSSNGTFVNGRRISGEVPISPNDVIRIGDTTLPWQGYFSDNHFRTPISSPTYGNNHVRNNVDVDSGSSGFGVASAIISLLAAGLVAYPTVLGIKITNTKLNTWEDAIDLFKDSISAVNNAGLIHFLEVAAFILGLVAISCGVYASAIQKSNDDKGAGSFGICTGGIVVIAAIFCFFKVW